jgi:hypothetical protein
VRRPQPRRLERPAFVGVFLVLACARDPLSGHTHIKWRENLGSEIIYGADEPDELHPKAEIEESFLLACVRQMWQDVHEADEDRARELKPHLAGLPVKLFRILAETGSAFVYIHGELNTFTTSTNKYFDFACRTRDHVVFCKSPTHTCETIAP